METKEGFDVERGLVGLCVDAASNSRESVEKWRRQRRTLERMPTHLAQALLRRLLSRRLVSPSLLEVFQLCIEEIDLKGESFVDAEWMAYLGAFHYLRSLNLSGCRGISNSAIWAISGMTSLKEVDLSRCSKITDAAVEHLLSIPNLQKLCISESGLTANGVMRLSSLRNLCVLDLGGLSVTDLALCSLQVLTQLEYLDLWGSKISNKGADVLKMFPKLSFLNVAWTNVTKLPILPSVTCLNMSKCTIHLIFEGENEIKAPVSKLLLPGAIFVDVNKAFSWIEASNLSFLDISGSPVDDFCFLSDMGGLEYLDLSYSKMVDSLIESVACAGANLRDLNLCNTRVGSAGIAILAGNVPYLETLSLSHTAVDDVALSYIGMMSSLRVIALSSTNIRGYVYCYGQEKDRFLSLRALQNLDHLERLDLEDTQVRDAVLPPLSDLRELNCLSLKNDFLSDICLQTLSSIPKLKSLGMRGAVLTNAGIHAFKPPAKLQILDLRECWLLTEDAVVAFCKKHPQISVKHEHVQIHSTDQNTLPDVPSPSRGTPRASRLRQKGGKLSQVHPSNQKENFVDERMKYSRAELMEMQFSLSRHSLVDADIVLPKMLAKE